ncbi:MAG: VacB/RNase II family 3'-5' exoribonuclease [Solobacterium sp.]|nr:VacB/RNase II family 3'-5' exoribonuclease [Solobacterium sp.]
MELEQRILDFLENRKKGKRKFSDILAGLGLRTEDEQELSKAITHLEKDDLLFLNGNHQYDTRSQAGVYEGKISINASGLGFLDYGEETLRIDENKQKGAMHGDVVLVKRLSHDPVYGEVIKIKERSKENLIATYSQSHHALHLVLDDPKLSGRPFRLANEPDFVPVDGLKVLCEIEQYYNPLTIRIKTVIGHKDDPGVDIAAILLEKNIIAEFPEEVIEQANAIPQSVSEKDLEGRRDLREEITVTIDGDGAKDFDDAVAITRNEDGFKVNVSIADVSYYVEEDTPLDIEARKRGTSTYVTDRVVPMLPHILSNGICSLNPKVDRLTITCSMLVSFDGEIKSYELFPSVIRSNERMTYHMVNKILDGDKEAQEKYAHLGNLFFDLAECADAIRRKRIEKGAMEFASTEAEITVDENGVPTDIQAVKRGHGEEIIEDYMIAANVCVASYLKWQEIPAIYRIHEKPLMKKIHEFIHLSELMGHKLIVGKSGIHPTEVQRYLAKVKDTEVYPVLSMLLLRCMQKAKYDNRCIGHFGLGEEEYLHFTSPIRRYPDLMTHRMLRKYAFLGNMDLKER